MGARVGLGYLLYEIAQVPVLAHGDGEADIVIAAHVDDVPAVEAAVGPHGELTGGPRVAHTAHRLPQEVGCTPTGVGSTLAQPRHQHLACSRSHGHQRVIAPLAAVVVATCSLLGQPVGLADGRV